MKHLLEAKHIYSGYNKQTILNDVSVKIPSQKISVIIGANGCGKSTLLKSLSRLLKPSAGHVELDGIDITTLKPKELAQRLGLLPQTPIIPEGLTVTELITRGRFPYQTLVGGQSKEDFLAVKEAIRLMKIEDIKDKLVTELSGGQRQRAWIAMSLAQDTEILLLDEPTTYLDIAHQIEILDLLTDLNRTKNTTIVMVLHDINLALRYADHIFAMKKGKLFTEGTPAEIINEQLIKDIFDLESLIITDPVSQVPMMIPKGRHHTNN